MGIFSFSLDCSVLHLFVFFFSAIPRSGCSVVQLLVVMSITRLAPPRYVGSECLYVSCTYAFAFNCGRFLRPSHTEFGDLHSPGRWVRCAFSLMLVPVHAYHFIMHLISQFGTMYWVGGSQLISLHMRFGKSCGIIST